MLKYYLQFSTSLRVLQRDSMLLPLEVETMQEAEQAAFDLSLILQADKGGKHHIFQTQVYWKYNDQADTEFVYFVITQ